MPRTIMFYCRSNNKTTRFKCYCASQHIVICYKIVNVQLGGKAYLQRCIDWASSNMLNTPDLLAQLAAQIPEQSDAQARQDPKPPKPDRPAEPKPSAKEESEVSSDRASVTMVRVQTPSQRAQSVDALLGEAGCLFSLGKPQNDSEAVKTLQRAAEQGAGQAQYELAVCYGLGIGIQEDREFADLWLRKSIKQGACSAQTTLSSLLASEAHKIVEGRSFYPRNPRLGVSVLKREADIGNGVAQALLAGLYRQVPGTETEIKPDAELSELWYRKARRCLEEKEELEDPLALYYLGCMQQAGDGGDVDYDAARRHLTKSSQKGNVDSSYMLGCIYRDGLGTAIDKHAAGEWFRKAAEGGHSEAVEAIKSLGND